MSKKNVHQCHQCKNSFPEQEVYRIGIKQKNFYCRECAKKYKSECMWCGKELVKKEWKILGGWWSIKSEEGKLTETIDRDDSRKEKHYKYYLTCEETREHGIRPNQSCPSRISDWWVEKGKQRYRSRENQGWKKCTGKGIYHKSPKTGKVIFDLDCYKISSTGKKYLRGWQVCLLYCSL